MLKTIMSLQVLVANEVLATNKVDGVEIGNKSIEKCKKLSKIGKLSKSKNLHFTTTTKKRNFLTFDIKTDFRFSSDFI